ncbi:MAG: NAD(P)/FAD-dependent oxidoreductase [Actinobacteria bacterium]|nr:NAD(P)/FAD-dependent oxidoreductase [Micrococcales bacterium]MCB0903127.1 NAD(P)/FAD-dependent oxidoreductase [Actinomycetota bacterium]MCO5299980.1 NAD(P)/FAD-dependent oxidoreductase [Candidatus Nanopelagicales bacterium]MCB9429801.1 NAD(P)/FAD-dependent oxidoreductase [Actinomycetota bacterium]HPE13010.1 FAD/NAD(P)-binding oxidoreductase [Actinomycetota bacterium]
MARTVILGAGIAGHTAALHLRRMLGKEHDVVVVSPNSKWNWIPSNIWVGVGKMDKKRVTFPLAPIYARKGVEFHQALATELHGEGSPDHPHPYVTVRYTGPSRQGKTANLDYDFLINATGPKLTFEATPGLGPQGNSWSVCTAEHAVETSQALQDVIGKLQRGTPQTLLIGMGHGTCTCQGAAFEYTFNVEHELVQAGVRDKAEVIYITNEVQLGDFGMDGMNFGTKDGVVPSQMFTESLFKERGVKAIMAAAVERVEPGVVHYEQLDGTKGEQAFDFAMLLPPFRGADLKAFDREGNEITDQVFAPSGFMKVDADYSPKPYEQWKPSDWPKTYQSVKYDNVWAAGIAFAPPHQMSKPHKTPNGTAIAPAPPRTGMPSGVIGRAVAKTIAERIKHGDRGKVHTASMADMGAACIASAGTGWRQGQAAAMTVYPIIPDKERYGEQGRDTKETYGEIGLSAHWMKVMLHHLFIYKAKARPLWYLIPE